MWMNLGCCWMVRDRMKGAPRHRNEGTWDQPAAGHEPMSKSRRGQLGWLRPELPSWCSDSWTNKRCRSELPSVGTVCYAAKTNWPVGVTGHLLSPTQCGILRSRHRNQAGEEAALLLLVKVGESGFWFLSQAGVVGVLWQPDRPALTESGSLWPLSVCVAPVILDHTGEQSWMWMQCGDLEGRPVYTWSFPSQPPDSEMSFLLPR